MTAIRMVLVPGSKDQPLLRYSRWREFHQQGSRAMFTMSLRPTFVNTRPTLRLWSCQSHDGDSNGASPRVYGPAVIEMFALANSISKEHVRCSTMSLRDQLL